MPRVGTLTDVSASPGLASTFAEIEGAFGMVPNLFKTYAHCPPLLDASWGKVKAVMMGGELSRKTKEAIAVLVSKDNSCRYCVAAHTGALKAIGVTDDEIARIERDVEQADFTPNEKALIAFVRAANADPNRIPDAVFAAVRTSGATDEQIVEALGVMEIFTSFNKFLDALEVEIDF